MENVVVLRFPQLLTLASATKQFPSATGPIIVGISDALFFAKVLIHAKEEASVRCFCEQEPFREF